MAGSRKEIELGNSPKIAKDALILVQHDMYITSEGYLIQEPLD